jgi:TonB-linked SusC/RagA family outer membrane protein
MKKLLLAGVCFMMLQVTHVFAQNQTIEGTVIAKDDGQPIPGVSVLIKGTSIGTQTNSTGKYLLTAPKGAVLQFEFIGYTTQTVTVGTGKIVNISLAVSSKQLGEVLVTGALGLTRTRNQQSYAAQQVSGDEVSKQRSSNFINGLSGKVSGLEIRQNNTLGGSTNVVLRGYKSIDGDNQALFVIDGVPINNENTNSNTDDDQQAVGDGGYDYGSPASDINPDDIESITILKGAGASALYGSRGSNGVILITTKKPKNGFNIVVNTTLSDNSVDKSTFPQYQTQYGGGYAKYFISGNVFGNANAKIAPTMDDASNGYAFNKNETVYQWDAFDPSSPNYGKATPWVAAANGPSTFFVNSLSTDNSIMVTKGDNNGTYKLGYTRSDENGVIPNNNMLKNQVDLAGTYKISPKLTAGASVNYYNTAAKGRGGTGYDDNLNRNVMSGFRQWWQTNVDVQELKEAYDRTQSNTTWNMLDPANGEYQGAYWNNPYWVVDHNYETDSRNRYLGNVNLNYKPTTWLTITGKASLDTYSGVQEERYDVSSVGVPYYSKLNHSFTENNYDLLATVDKDITHDLNLKALLGGNIRKDNDSSVYVTTNNGLVKPGVYTLGNSVDMPVPAVRYDARKEVDGIFAGATLTWKQMLTLDGTIRRDVSSTLAPNYNTYYYPSVSGGFIFSELLKNYDWLSYGKIRANYAEVGSDAPYYAAGGDTYTVVPSFGNNLQYITNSTKNNPDLKPERTRSKEIGLELEFFDSRLGFDGTYYVTNTFDEILPIDVSPAFGYENAYYNAGSVQNKGVELSLNGTPVKTRDFSWKISVNFTAEYNKVTSLYKDGNGNEATNIVLGEFTNGETTDAPLGGSYGTIMGTDYTYNKKGQKIVGADGQYILNTSESNVIGNTNPDWTGGINDEFRYKNFSLSFLIDIRHGGSVFSDDMAYGLADGLYPLTAYKNDLGNPVRNSLATGGGMIRPGVYTNGKTNTTRVTGANYGDFGDGGLLPNSAFVYDASYVKLREALIGYDMPQSILKKLGPVKGITFQLIGRNLWIIHKNLPYADPEDGLSAGNLQGVQAGSYPTTRTISFNLKLSF